MANSFNTDQTSITSASTDIDVFTATASTTLIKSVRVVHASGTSSATLSITKSGSSTRSDMNTVALSQNELTDLIGDVLPLESGDVLKVRTSHQPSEVFVSYVENTTSVSAQSIDVLSDVDITTSAPTNGQTLVWNDSANEFQPGDAGGSTATLDDIGNVDTTGKSTNDVLLWNGSNWVDSTRLTELYTLLKSGTSKTLTAEPTNADETEGFVKLEATTAALKVNTTGLEISETSPGDVEFIVATDSAGSTAFTAMHLDGTTTASQADFIIKQGTSLAIEGNSSATAKFRNTNSGNTLITVPASTGTMALTSDIASDSAVVANTAKTSFPGFGTSAGTALEGDTTTISTAQANAITANTAKNSYPSADATKLSGIETGADVTDTTNVAAAGALMDSEVTNLAQVKAFDSSDYATAAQGSTADSALQDVIDDTSPELGGDLDVKAQKITTSTSNGNIELDPNGTGLVQVNGNTNPGAIKLMCEAGSHGVTIQSPDHAEQANYTLTLPTTNGSSNQVLKTDGNGVLSWTNQATGGGSPTAYDYDAFTTSANVTMNADVSVASNKIVDIMGDALAAKNNANAKKFLGFHTGSGVCVLQGMVNASGSISGASAGSPLWLGASGAFSATAPDTADEYSRIVGYFVASLQGGQVMCYFNPSQDWVQIDS